MFFDGLSPSSVAKSVALWSLFGLHFHDKPLDNIAFYFMNNKLKFGVETYLQIVVQLAENRSSNGVDFPLEKQSIFKGAMNVFLCEIGANRARILRTKSTRWFKTWAIKPFGPLVQVPWLRPANRIPNGPERQKRHHTRLFRDSPGPPQQPFFDDNVLPGTVVDSEFDFYLCSHWGVKRVLAASPPTITIKSTVIEFYDQRPHRSQNYKSRSRISSSTTDARPNPMFS
ncbi:hypothetical protein L6452_13127 [Arctium lappa]|uniref:Uncharacterized protein n=1 Tax=Arctium lappa TaxID=4217 RepID=A0ACB9CHQ6_ARCLA|nr:hypothetical protein L6452_13127 [Arctium lappa]